MSSQRTFLLQFMTLFLLERQLHSDFYFISILVFTLEACARDNLILGIGLIKLGFIIGIVVGLSFTSALC